MILSILSVLVTKIGKLFSLFISLHLPFKRGCLTHESNEKLGFGSQKICKYRELVCVANISYTYTAAL